MKQCVLKRFTEDRVRVETENLIDILINDSFSFKIET